MHILTPAQCRAARALLNWSQPDLANRCDVHVQTISNFEQEQSTPNKSTLEKVTYAFEVSGIIFTDDEGVKKNKNVVMVLEGPDANRQYLNNLYYDVKHNPGSEVLLSGVRQVDKSLTDDRQFIEDHVARLQKRGVTERVIMREGDRDFIGPQSWYRWIPEKYFSYAPFQLYNEKLALKDLEGSGNVYIIENPVFAKAFRNLFNFVWDHCKVPK